MPSTKTLRVTLQDIVGGTGGSGSTAVVHARYVTSNGRGRDVHLTDGTIVVPVRRSVTPGTGPEEFDFTVIPSDDGDVREADRGFLTEVSWTVTAPEGGKAHGVRRVVVPSTADAVVQLGLLSEPTPAPAAPTSTTLDGGDASDPAYLLRMRRDTTAGWEATNPVLSAGEPGVDLDTGEQRIGDGGTPWADLPGPPVRANDGAGPYTAGHVVKVGTYATNLRYDLTGDVGTGMVAGGAPNYENVVGGNLDNVDTATSNLTGAPALTGEDGNWAFVLAGYDNVVNGWASVVSGFHIKVNPGANHVTIAGGSRHTVNAAAVYPTVSGGTGHIIGGASATIAGGTTNTATGNNSTVSGGNNNQATASASTISGGSTNTATGNNSVIVGGNSNTASGLSSTAVGGQTNTAAGIGSTVPGGRSNTATADYSQARGYGAVATNFAEDAHAANSFATPGDAQASRMVLSRQTTDATASDLRLNNATPALCPENTTWVFRALVVARRTDADGENATWEVRGAYKRDAGNTGAFVGTPTVTSLGANAGNTWALTTGSYSTGNLRLIGTGEAAKTIRWVANLEVTQVQG